MEILLIIACQKGCLWDFHWIPMGSIVFCMIFQRNFYGISMGLKMDFYGIPMVFPWDSYGNALAFLWDFHDMSMVFLWDYSRTAMESTLKSIENQLKVN